MSVLAGPEPSPPAGRHRPWSGWPDLLTRNPGTVVTVGAAVLIAAQLVLRGWIAAQGWFHLDDLVFVSRAERVPFGWDYLLHDHAGHVMPGGYVLVSLLTALVPLHWPAVVALNLLWQLLIGLAMFRLLVTLFGRRPAVLLPMAVFTTTSLTLPASVWWAAALNQLPLQLAMLLALTWHVRWLRGRRGADLVRTVAAVLGGLLFSEKTLLVLPLLLVVTVAWFGTGGPRERLAGVWRRYRAAWISLGVVGVLYAGWYVLTVPSPMRGDPAGGGLATLLGIGPLRAVLPGLLGGPWTWEQRPPTLSTAAPPTWAAVLACVVGLGVVVATVLAHRGAVRAWLLVAGWLVVDYALVAGSRGQVLDVAVFAREYRYVTDAAPVVVLALGLACLPVRDAPEVLRPRRGGPAARLRGVVTGRSAPAAAAATCLVLLAGSVVSGIGYAQGWRVNPARDWVATARADLAANPGVVLVDTQVPDAVMWRLLGPYYTLDSAVLAAAPEQPRFLAEGESSPDLRMLDDTGALVRAWVPPTTSAPPGPAPGCGYRLGAGPVLVPLRTPVDDGRWMIRIAYLSAAENTAVLRAGGRTVQVQLPAGLADVFVPVSGQIGSVGLELRDPTRSVCVGQVEVGVPAALPKGF